MQINPKALSTTCMKDPAKNKANGKQHQRKLESTTH